MPVVPGLQAARPPPPDARKQQAETLLGVFGRSSCDDTRSRIRGVVIRPMSAPLSHTVCCDQGFPRGGDQTCSIDPYGELSGEGPLLARF